MKINIVAVGKIKEKFYIEAIDEYKKRLSKFCELNIIEVPEKSFEQNIDKKVQEESKLLFGACKGPIVLLDRQGRQISSPELSQIIDHFSMQTSTINFVIGGSNGVDEALKQSAKQTISFGKITYPHQLFRVVLTEQIYRAFTIINGLPYHK